MRPYCDNTQTPSAERVLSDEELIVLLDTLHQHQTEHRIDHEDNASTYEIGATKNGKERRVPISDSLQAVFDRIKALHGAYGGSQQESLQLRYRRIGEKEGRKPVKSRLSALLNTIARGGLEPLSQNKNPVKKGDLAHRHASVSNLYPTPILHFVNRLIK